MVWQFQTVNLRGNQVRESSPFEPFLHTSVHRYSSHFENVEFLTMGQFFCHLYFETSAHKCKEDGVVAHLSSRPSRVRFEYLDFQRNTRYLELHDTVCVTV